MSLDAGDSSGAGWQQYQPPAVAVPQPPPSKPLLTVVGLGKALVVMLSICATVDAASAIDDIASLMWMSGEDADRSTFYFQQSDSWVQLSSAISLFSVLAFVATAAVWITWQFRVSRNVQVWGVHTRRRPGWAIAGWLVPIISLWFPAQDVHDVLRGSDPEAAPGKAASALPKQRIIPLWWTFLLAAFIVGRFPPGFDELDTTNGTWRQIYTVDLATCLAFIAAAIPAIIIVRRITAHQAARFAQAADYWSQHRA